jgi:hypothetical protein
MYKYLLAIALIPLSMQAFSNPKADTTGVGLVCYSFVKAIHTKDTLSFYDHVDKGRLTEYINLKHEEARLTADNVFYLFFHAFSPSGTRSDALMRMRQKAIFSKFRIDVLNDDEQELKVKVEWLIEPAYLDKISLTLRLHDDHWKVIAADW